MPWLVHVEGIDGGFDVPDEKVSPYLPASSKREYNELLQDAAIEVILEEHGEELAQRVSWYPEEYVPLDDRKKKS